MQKRKLKYMGRNLPSAGRLNAWVTIRKNESLQLKPRWTAAVTITVDYRAVNKFGYMLEYLSIPH